MFFRFLSLRKVFKILNSSNSSRGKFYSMYTLQRFYIYPRAVHFKLIFYYFLGPENSVRNAEKKSSQNLYNVNSKWYFDTRSQSGVPRNASVKMEYEQ